MRASLKTAALAVIAALALAACGEPPAAVEEAKTGAIDFAQEAAKAAARAVDTRTACVLAGQSDAFCGCVQERLGPNLSEAHVDALATVLRRAIGGEGVQAAAERAETLDPRTRDALVQCATTAAVQGATEGAAE